jgi:hypothetical protein
MQWDYSSIYNCLLALSVIRIENEQDAFLTTERQQPPGYSINFFQAKNVAVEVLGSLKVIYIKGGFHYAAELRRVAPFGR